MTDNLRRSTRRRKQAVQQESSSSEEEDQQYIQGQGIVIKEGDDFALLVVEKDVGSKAKQVNALRLVDSGDQMKYQAGSSAKIKVEDILSEVEVKKAGKFYKITKKQLNDIKKDLGLVQTAAPAKQPKYEEKPTKVAKVSKAKGKNLPKTFKKGVFNPNVKLVAETELMTGGSNQPIFDISITVNNKNLHRAAATHNTQLLKTILKSNKKISSLTAYWGPECQLTPLQLAVLNNNFEAAELIIDEIEKPKMKRAYEPPPGLAVVTTGSVGIEAFGVYTRTVQMSRGGREGNNALMHDHIRQNRQFNTLTDPNFMQAVAPYISADMLNWLIRKSETFANSISRYVGDIVRAGNMEAARDLITYLNKRGGYGFNFLHEEVLKASKLTQFKKVSITKKPIENYLIAPLHVACINPNTQHLESLLSQADDVGYVDLEGRRPVHYAAACSSPDAIKALSKYGVNVNDMDKKKVTPLMLAAKYNRQACIEELLKAGANINVKSRETMAAIHYACQAGSLQAVQILLANGADPNMPGQDRMTPLMYASQQGHYEVVEELLENGAKTLSKDKCKRTALIWAVKNGWVHIASLLLQRGAPINEPDSSKNYAIHYACAYGWMECLELLLANDADKNAHNDWKLEPLLVAMLKGHFGIVKRLLDEPGIDVNCKDDQGRTLLSQSIAMITTESIEQMRFLLEKKNANPNIPDVQGLTPLHHLCSLPPPEIQQQGQSIEELALQKEEAWNLQVQTAELLLANGADINAKNTNGQTALFCAFTSGNSRLVDVLINNGANMEEMSNDEDTILHKLAKFNQDTFPILETILNNERLVKISINQVDKGGYTPLLRLLQDYAANATTVWNKIQQEEYALAQEILRKTQEELQEGEDIAQKLQGNPLFLPPNVANINIGQQQDSFGFGVGMKVPIKMAAPAVKFALKGGARTKQTARRRFGNLGYSSITYADSGAFNVSINKQEIAKRTDERYNDILDALLSLLNRFYSLGADFTSHVEKLYEYRVNPEKRQAEYQEALKKKAKMGNLTYGYEVNDSDYFITDFEGNTVWKEYDENGMRTALHFAVLARDDTIFQNVLQKSEEVNYRDFYGGTPLMRGVESGSSTRSLQLIQSGSDPNLANWKGETPLLLASVNQNDQLVRVLTQNGALGNTTDLQGRSPLREAVISRNVAIVEILLEAKVDPNIIDLKQRTPLHHAFNHADVSANASFEIEALLLEYGSDINAADIRGRTPLHYAFVKIGKPNDFSNIDPIETVSSACGRPGVDTNKLDRWNKTPLHYAAGRGAITSSMMLLSSGTQLDVVDEDGNTPLALSIIHDHPNYAVMLLQQGSDGLRDIYVKEKKEKKSKHQLQSASFMTFGFGQMLQPASVSQGFPELKPGKYSMFQAAIIKGWQGLAYLLLQKGYDYMLAMQNAMNEKKFQLVLTLLAKVGDDSIVQRVNSDGQNLFHTFAMYGAEAPPAQATAICQKLKRRGIEIDTPDSFGRTPLHYACRSHFVQFITYALQENATVDAVDNKGKTPLVCAIKKSKILQSESIIDILQHYKVNMNVQFEQEGVQITPLIHAISQGAPLTLIVKLINNGASIVAPDSLGRTPLIHSIIMNNSELVVGITPYLNKDHFNYKTPNGWNSLNYVIRPLEYGSYENVDLFKLLCDSGADIHSVDINGHSIYWHAYQQKSWRIKQYLDSLGLSENVDFIEEDFDYQNEMQEIDYETDAEQYIQNHKKVQNLRSSINDPDEVGGFGSNYKVVDDYSLYMVRVDLSYGPYSAYLFYRMQLLHDINRDVFVVFTRWGRIGESGAFQRTPFSVREEAETEFKKIFRNKTGNDWGKTFVKQPKKYNLMKLTEQTKSYSDFLEEFDYSKAPDSNLPEPNQNLLKLMTYVKTYNNFMQNSQVDNRVLNFSNISRETLDEAMSILKELGPLTEMLQKTKNQGDLLEIKGEIYDLSNRFYENIPLTGYQNSIVPGILSPNDVKNKMEFLQTLYNFECASKIIIGASNRLNQINPLDYCQHALECSIVPLDKLSSEYKTLEKYVGSGQGDISKIINIFKIARKGELQRIQEFSDINQRKLLWHGSHPANFISLLKQGLKIAPPEAPTTGWMFGKGVYFADMFQKSQGYSISGMFGNVNVQAQGNLMLACEVVTGNELIKYNAEAIEKLPKNKHCVKAIGRQEPDSRYSVFLPDGVEVPIGPIIQAPEPKKKDLYISLNYNEYIVYNVNQIRMRYLIHFKSPHDEYW